MSFISHCSMLLLLCLTHWHTKKWRALCFVTPIRSRMEKCVLVVKCNGKNWWQWCWTIQLSLISPFFPNLKTKLGLFKLSLRHLRTTQLLLILFWDSKQRKEDVENETSVDENRKKKKKLHESVSGWGKLTWRCNWSQEWWCERIALAKKVTLSSILLRVWCDR